MAASSRASSRSRSSGRTGRRAGALSTSATRAGNGGTVNILDARRRSSAGPPCRSSRPSASGCP
eukprot:9852432-Alexandrium_andersonii.AAC.1